MIRFGIIGCGNVAPTYVYTLNKNPNAEVIAVADTDIKATSNIQTRYNVKAAYQDYKEMLHVEQIDAVVICTPHFMHYEQAVHCSAQKKDILCEKPLSVTLPEIEKMIDACKSVRFSVMLQRRFYPNTIATADVINAGLLGQLKQVSLKFTCHKSEEFYSTWRGKKISGGGVLLSQALHRIDQLAFIFGDAIAVDGKIECTRSYIEVEDYAKGQIFFPKGIIVDIEANNTSGNSDTISIIHITGTKGEIILSDDKTTLWDVIGVQAPEEVDINAIPTSHRPAYYGPCHEKIIDDFVNSITEDRPPIISGRDAIASMKIIFGFYEASRKKSKITF